MVDHSESEYRTLIVSAEDREEFKRLDQYLAKKIPDFSRTFLQNLFEKGEINLVSENAPMKLELKKMPPIGSEIEVHLPPPMPAEAQPENLPLDILYEDEHLVIINKAQGMVTHPAPGNYTGTLVNAVLFHCKDIKGVGDQKRPGIVHRLDKGTSGVMVVAKNQKCHEGLVLLFSTHDIERYYEALVMGSRMEPSGRLESTIGRDPHNRLKMAANVRHGKRALTYYKTLAQYEHFAHVEFKLETGRTHQIRVHAAELLKRALLMDPLYGNPNEHRRRLGETFGDVLKEVESPFLHAKVLGFVHPITKEKLRFEVPPPKIFQDVLNLGRGHNPQG